MARIFSKQFWTLSVWEDDAALGKFVVQTPHAQVMSARWQDETNPLLRWSIRGSEYPPRWDEALQKRDAAERDKA